ncbi:2,5-diamino-6-(ribosylamino)-4(3H)-pyrimidinone 5'-phosphate reductase [Methanophagales archaeon]|nr:2,5-diamino-6-(ribosylamino)-4(3H)-pyrimidinone 5'-phosphate reductase [Methanophagales archaeon]RJS69574.1 MAG: 2,5-diamino-6-(ribosylamino)-4(3H)-pyrimidinone 5'-phosphate reductase [Methanophagales archaeon]RJS79933.1 MAG: 2,5-diamino-6-(ribosylamino)-4(3H)-pyrimidinone 5'-phosphate reductase [Methanophagales archaeon]RLG34314.1 MAG: 2,5-diamino-6-(ribosylamino)-4(3H)-pyrimidinone 5'-phosphate reductase [Methanosarcinales archaeon]
MEKPRPFVFINAAMSADGKIATIERRQTRISSERDFDRVDSLKAESDAIMVGVGTILADNPSLTVKSEKRREERRKARKDENPLRIVVDSKARTPVDAEILNKGEGKRIIAVSKQAIVENVERLGEKAEILICGNEEVNLRNLLYLLWQRGVSRLMVEGGAMLNWSLISQGLVDEIYIYVGNMIIGGEYAPTLVDGNGFIEEEKMVKLELLSAKRMDEGILLRWRVRK